MKHLIVALSLLSFMACGGKKIVMTEGNTAKADGVMAMTVAWVKDKGKKYDIRLSLTNEREEPVIVFLSDIGCFKGNLKGEAKHTFFNTGERTIDFNPGESKTFNLVCRLSAENSGATRINIARVYDNPSGDGKTTGKVIARNIDWKSGGAAAEAPAAPVEPAKQ